jgi:hypothetical protein
MFTADDARDDSTYRLDERIRKAVKDNDAGPNAAYLRVYCDDPWRYTIKEELEKRGFKNVDVPEITICGDVYFEWGAN